MMVNVESHQYKYCLLKQAISENGPIEAWFIWLLYKLCHQYALLICSVVTDFMFERSTLNKIAISKRPDTIHLTLYSIQYTDLERKRLESISFKKFSQAQRFHISSAYVNSLQNL